MKKSELKNIIKECVKEVIFEEGVLSGIISEVAKGMSNNVVTAQTNNSREAKKLSEQANMVSGMMDTKRKEVMDAIGRGSYEDLAKRFQNPEFFEGTVPLNESRTGSLSNQQPADAGLDISNIPGFGSWGKVANKAESK